MLGAQRFMRQHLAFFRHRLGSRHAHALAQWPQTGWGKSAPAVCSMHQLGLHYAVAKVPWDGMSREAGAAIVASLAALGQVDEARALLAHVLRRHKHGPHLSTLVSALAPYAPDVALLLAEKAASSATLRGALFLKLGDRLSAKRVLQTVVTTPHEAAERELLLSNTERGSPNQLLYSMNAFLAYAGLSPLALMDESLPPGPLNLRSAETLPEVHGPCVSVLMTAFNAANRIGRALDGLLTQTWRNLQIIVVDDASTDGTAKVVEEVASRDARVHLLRVPINLGTYLAKSIGLEAARGDYVTCHDADDWSHPQRIARQMRPLLEKPRLIATTSRWVRMTDQGEFHARAVFPLTRLNPASPLFRREVVRQEAGLWDVVRTGADSEFTARLRLVFGEASVQRLTLPMTFGSHRADSLMTAAATGHSAHSLSPTRQAYWEAWTLWHIDELRAGRLPRTADVIRTGNVNFLHPFHIPNSLRIDRDRLAAAINFAYFIHAQAPHTLS